MITQTDIEEVVMDEVSWNFLHLYFISLSQSAATKKKPKKKKGGGGGGGGAVTRVTSAGKGSIELHQLLMSFLLFWTELSQGKLWKLLVEDVSQHYLYEIEL